MRPSVVAMGLCWVGLNNRAMVAALKYEMLVVAFRVSRMRGTRLEIACVTLQKITF